MTLLVGPENGEGTRNTEAQQNRCIKFRQSIERQSSLGVWKSCVWLLREMEEVVEELALLPPYPDLKLEIDRGKLDSKLETGGGGGDEADR